MKLITDQKTPEPETPEPENPETQESQAEPSGNEPDFESITAEFGEPDPDPAADDDVSANASGLLTRDQFFAAFKSIFNVAAVVPVPPLPLESLAIKPQEEQSARAASDVMYDIAVESPYFRWLIEPQSVWVQRAVVLGSFASVKFIAVRAEIRSKNARPVNDKPGQKKPAGQSADDRDIRVEYEAMKGALQDD